MEASDWSLLEVGLQPDSNKHDLGPLTCRGRTKEMANVQMQDNRVIDIIKLLRLEGLFRAPSREIDHCLISALVERSRPETHTFHLPHGEMLITLQDVEVIFGLPIDGDILVGPTAVVDDGGWRQLSPRPHDAMEMQIHQYARCYILALVGDKLFMDKSGDRVHLMFLDFMRNLHDLPQYSWGSGCLAWLYKELCRTSEKWASQIGGACTLVQYWAWARWVRVPSPKSRPSGMALVHYREQLVTMQPEQIVWQPYEAHFGHLPEFCVAGRDTWTARVPLIQSHLALLAMLPKGSQAHNHVRRVLNNVAGLGGGPAVNEHANNGHETELAATATPSTSATPISTPTRSHRATSSPSTSATKGRGRLATASPSTSRGRGRSATTPRVVISLEMPPPIPQASPQPEVPSPIPYASPLPEVPSPSPPSQPNFDVGIDQNVTPPILPETPSYPHTGSTAPTPGLYIEHDYPPTASSSDPLGPPVGIDTLQPHTDDVLSFLENRKENKSWYKVLKGIADGLSRGKKSEEMKNLADHLWKAKMRHPDASEVVNKDIISHFAGGLEEMVSFHGDYLFRYRLLFERPETQRALMAEFNLPYRAASNAELELACTLTFVAVNGTSCDAGINHPNQYFSDSQKVLPSKVVPLL
uniref:Aminotransferase-like plant mobile domain-containing protein n=1 Tax=Quercus lobata TaxID=97700 RepID=A0A7N2MUX7_QUELO